MIRKFKDTQLGNVIVRNVIFDIDGTNLEEGINIDVEGRLEPIKIFGYYDLEKMTSDELDDLLY